jgi:hypothetical protein
MEIASTWAEKRTILRKTSKVGTFVWKSMQELRHNEVLLALEARVQNCCGLAQASAKGLRMIMETMTFGNHFISFEEAFHLYSSYFTSNTDEVAFRDKLLHQERGLNVRA